MPNFINTDFEFISGSDLSIISEKYSDKLLILFNQEIDGLYHLSFEISLSQTLDEILHEFFHWFENLLYEHRTLILNSQKKIIDIGFESGKGQTLVSVISPNLLQKIAEMDFELVITLYPMDS